MGGLIFQTAPRFRPAWLDTCMNTVKKLAEVNGYDYKFLENPEFFGKVSKDNPLWKKRLFPQLSDICRFIWIKDYLNQYDSVVWIDADGLVISNWKFEYNGMVWGTLKDTTRPELTLPDSFFTYADKSSTSLVEQAIEKGLIESQKPYTKHGFIIVPVMNALLPQVTLTERAFNRLQSDVETIRKSKCNLVNLNLSKGRDAISNSRYERLVKTLLNENTN